MIVESVVGPARDKYSYLDLSEWQSMAYSDSENDLIVLQMANQVFNFWCDVEGEPLVLDKNILTALIMSEPEKIVTYEQLQTLYAQAHEAFRSTVQQWHREANEGGQNV